MADGEAGSGEDRLARGRCRSRRPTPKALRDELLESAKVKAIAVKRADQRELIIEMDMPAQIDAHYDLRDASWLTLIADALMVYVAPDDRAIRVVGEPGMKRASSSRW